MADDVQVTTMGCEACNGQFPVADMRSREGRVICKHCFAREREAAPATPADARGGGQKLRLKGANSCQVWTIPGQHYNLCGFDEAKTRFFAAHVDAELLTKTAKTLDGGAEPENVLGGGFIDVPLSELVGAQTAADSAVLELHIDSPEGARRIGLTCKNVMQKNQVFVELANGVADRLLCQSDMATDWASVSRVPMVFTVVLLILTVAVCVILAVAGWGSAALIALLAGLVLTLAGGLWLALDVARTPKRPIRMSLVPHRLEG